MNIRKGFAVLLLGVAPVLTGCYKTTRIVPIAMPPEQLITAPLNQLLKQTNDRYAALTTMTASIQITASTGGNKQGKIDTYPTFSGHMLMRKPADLRVLLSYLGMRAMDMATDGKTFKMVIPLQNRAITGSNDVTTSSTNPIENLRPDVFLDSMFVRGLGAGELVSLTMDERIYQPDPKKKDLIDEPDYDLSILRQKTNDTTLQMLRVIHIGRSSLLPYRQDIYDDHGQLVTQATYENYQKFGETEFPTKVTIKRPIDQLSIVVTVSNLIPNQPLEDDQFQLPDIPATYKVQKLQ